jgi:membrane protein implicated in regulation of membrane protease activity
MSVIFGVPTTKFVAIVIGKTVAAPIVIVITVTVFTLVPPVSVVVVFSVIFVVLVFVSKSCVSGKHKKAENDDRKAFSSIQSFPPT